MGFPYVDCTQDPLPWFQSSELINISCVRFLLTLKKSHFILIANIVNRAEFSDVLILQIYKLQSKNKKINKCCNMCPLITPFLLTTCSWTDLFGYLGKYLLLSSIQSARASSTYCHNLYCNTTLV